PRKRPKPNYSVTNAHEYNESLKRRGQLCLYGSVAVRPTLKLGREFLSCAMKKTKTPRTTLAPGLAKVLKRLH
ncbi:hypothetical protein AB3X90_41325, partial [Paraburkholderia sp. BR14427]